MKTYSKRMIGAALLLSSAGCDGLSLTGRADVQSDVVVAMAGDLEAQQASGSSAASPQQDSSSSGSGTTSTGTATGQIDTSVRVYVRSSGGSWVELTRGAARQTVDASGRDGLRVIATSELAARTYNRVRVEFGRVDANVTGGVQIGTNLLTGAIRVDAGSDDRITIEREVAIDARSSSTVNLEIDLNASAWLSRANASARTVSEADFRSAVRVSAR